MDLFRPFSVRHKKALMEKRIRPSLSKKLRSRIWYILGDLDHTTYIYPDPADRWNKATTILAELSKKLLKTYGTDKLEAFVDRGGRRGEVDLKGFVNGAFPEQVLDVIELMYSDLESESRIQLQQEINQTMRDENCPWIICDGQFVQMDAKFFEDEILSRANELLSVDQFEGAKEEFVEARNDFSVGDYKGAIHNACKAFESVMKAIENRSDGNASELIKGLEEVGFYENLPEPIQNGFGKQVLASLPYIRNRLGGHGQGSEIIDVSKQVAKLALHMGGSFIVFLIEQYLEISGHVSDSEENKDDNKYNCEDDIPF